MTTYAAPDKEDLHREIAELEPLFANFHDYRDLEGKWRQLVKRELSQPIPPAIAVNQGGIDFQSPDPEKAIHDHIAICKMNPPLFDVAVPGEGQRYRDLERDQLLVKASWFNRDINPRRRWESRIYEGLIRDGIKVEWLRPKECRTYEDGEDEDKPRMGCPNYFDNTLIDGHYWRGDGQDGADAHYYRFSVPVSESGIKNKAGKRVTLDMMGNIGWLGEDERYDYVALGNKQIDVVVRDARDLLGVLCPLKGCDHVRRIITVYVCPHGTSLKDKAEEVESYPSPFPGSSFFVIGGLMLQTERDPHQIYRPMMVPMYVLQAWLNMFITWWAVLAVNESSDRDIYANASQSRPENLASLGMGEGGALTSVPIPETGTNEMAVVPFNIERLPKATSVQLAAIIKEILHQMSEYKPNRAMTGINYTEQSNATASMGLAALQQSGIPYMPLLDEVSGAIDKWDQYTDHQIRWQAQFEPEGQETRYYATITGDENISRYRSTVKRGEQAYLDAKKCVSHDLIVSIENMTWAEKQAKWYLAESKYMAGVFTVEDLIKDAGVFDVEGQMRRLFRGQIRQSLQPLLTRMYDLKMTREASITSGFDFGSILQQVSPEASQSEPGGGPTTQAANTARATQNPTVALPAISTPSGGTGGMT